MIFARIGVRIGQISLLRFDLVMVFNVVLHGRQLINGMVSFAVGKPVVLWLLIDAR